MAGYIALAIAVYGLYAANKNKVNQKSPRVGSLQLQTAVQGKPIPIIYGMSRVAGNLIDYDDFRAFKHKVASGGKGGGGGTTTNYTYTASFLIGLCEGEITGINRAWKDKELFALDYSVYIGEKFTFHMQSFELFVGTETQGPFGSWEVGHPEKALNYRGQSYLASASYDLKYDPSMPNFSFEIVGKRTFLTATTHDAVPSDIAFDLLTNPIYGIGIEEGLIDSFESWKNYCVSAEIFISPVYDEQRPAQDILKSLAAISNTAIFFSEGKIKAVPYGDESITNPDFPSYAFVPNITPVYDLTYDDFLATDGEMPLLITRSNNTDAFNQVQIQFYDRNNQYNDSVSTAQDLLSINRFGLRPLAPLNAYEICEPDVAATVSQLLLQRALHIRLNFEFKLGIKYSLLEPMDIVTLTDENLGLDELPVRILSIEEDDESTLIITAEEYLGGVASNALYPNQEAGGYAANYNQDPGDANLPIIFEPPENLSESALEVWIFASGGEYWGGCQVWLSSDDASYSFYTTIEGSARQGVLSDLLGTSSSDPDLTNTLSVDLSMGGGQVLSGSQEDVDAYNTLCYVDGELIAYRDSNLVAAEEYNLSYLRRGVYNTTISSHAAGTQFTRIDPSVAAKYQFDSNRIGQTIYIKLVSFNIWGGGIQDISDVTAHSYTITGSAMNSPPDDVDNLHTNYRANLLYLYWDEAVDFRPIEYEIRTGTTWAEATVLGRIAQPGYPLPGDGDFWVAARAIGANGASIYSYTPTHIAISGAILTRNIIATIDEVATGWTGTASGGAVVAGGILQLEFTGDISAVADMTTLTDVGAYGDVSPSGAYTASIGHRIVLADITDALVTIAYDVTAYIAGSGVSGDPGPDVDVIPQVRLSLDGGSIWGAWQDYKPGNYVFSALDWRINLETRNVAVTPQVSGLKITVDVPAQYVSGHIQTSNAGTVLFTYAKKFNGGADTSGGGTGLPVAQITILNAQAGDIVRITNKTLQDFEVDVVNAGSRVVRNLDITLDGY